MLGRCCFSVITLLLTMTIAASVPAAPVVASPSDSAAAANAANQKPQEKAKVAKPVVVEFENLCTKENVMRLGDYIQLTIQNIDGLKKDPLDTTAFLRPLLFIDNIPMTGMYAEYILVKPDTGKPTQAVMTFQLRRDSTNLKVWDVFYQSPGKWKKREVRVTAGYDRTQVFATAAAGTNKPMLVLVRTSWIWLVGLFILGLIVAFVYCAKKSNLLRIDFGTPTVGINMPFSLARSQLGSWTLVILSCYLLVWLATGTLPPITGSTLVLLGLSLATLTGGKFVDISRDTQQVQLISAKVSKGFFTDIISDEKGVSIHRFQMVAWTIVLSGYFIIHTFKNLAFPQLDESLLILMGISNVTYLGLKIPEKVSEQPTTPGPDPLPDPNAEQVRALQADMNNFRQEIERVNFDLRNQVIVSLSHEVAAYSTIQQAAALNFLLANEAAIDKVKAVLKEIQTEGEQAREKGKTELETLFTRN